MAARSKPVKEILIVDDNALNIRLLSAFLSKSGFTHHTSASNGFEAVELFKQNPARWAAVLMDLSMPIMDGVTATKEIRAWERRMSRLGRSRSGTGVSTRDAMPLLAARLGNADSMETVREWRYKTEHEAPPTSEEAAEGRDVGLLEPAKPSPPPTDIGEKEDEVENITEEMNAGRPGEGPLQHSPPTSATTAEKCPLSPVARPALQRAGSETESVEISSSHASGVQIIVITGLGSATARFEATSAGADVFMTKPIQFGSLMKTLRSRLGEDSERLDEC